MAEQLDRIEAAVLSLADAFGKLQRQVSALEQPAAPPPQPGASQAAKEPAASGTDASSAAEAPRHAASSSPRASCSSVGTSWDDESFAEPTSEA